MDKKVYSWVVKKALIGLAVIFLFGCDIFSRSSPLSTTNTDTPTGQISFPTASPIPSTSDILQICPTVKPLEKDLPIEGSLIYWDYTSTIFLSFPDLKKTEIEQERTFTGGSTSPNGKYFSTGISLYDQDGNFKGHFLSIFDATGKLIESDPWQDDWTGTYLWLNNDELMFSYHNGSVLIYNPFLKSTRQQPIDLPDNQNIDIRTIDPSFRTVVFRYLDSNLSSWRNNNNATRIWDIKNQKDIIVLRDEYDDLVYRIALSHDKTKVAITTTTPNEEKFHSEIIVVNNIDGSYFWLSDFRSLFDEILITDVEWSFDGWEIYFWGATNINALNLYSINVQSKQVKQYCFEGSFRPVLSNAITWVADMPDFYLVNDSRNYINQDETGLGTWDVLLVDSKNNVAYLVAKNIATLGWLTSR